VVSATDPYGRTLGFLGRLLFPYISSFLSQHSSARISDDCTKDGKFPLEKVTDINFTWHSYYRQHCLILLQNVREGLSINAWKVPFVCPDIPSLTCKSLKRTTV
jgi:hypothetical protein